MDSEKMTKSGDHAGGAEPRDMQIPVFLAGKSKDSRPCTRDIEALPFFGPVDPPRWPLHKTLFLCGILFPPLWFVGACLKVRDTDDNWSELFRGRCQAAAMISVIVGVALILLETVFKDT